MDEGRTFPLALTPSATWAGAEAAPGRTVRASRGGGIFATIVTVDRVAQGRILARTARECHPDARLAVLTPQSGEPPEGLADLYDFVIPAEELPLSSLADLRFRYTTAELCFALKPWLIRHLLERFRAEPIYYVDADIEIFSPLAEAEAALAQGANLVLTPHILQPGGDDGSERALLRSGSFNAGFVGVAPSAQARAFVAWWCEKVKTGCTNDHPQGTYGDQKWLELAPSICDGVIVLRHPGYNFAYWNGHERPLSCLSGTWTAAGLPLRFVHYSQWNTRTQDAEAYLAQYFRTDYQQFAGLFADYRRRLHEEGDDDDAPLRPAYGEVRSPAGERVPDLIRQAYERHSPATDGGAPEVFGRAVAVLNAPSAARKHIADLPITVLYDEIRQRHGDLKDRFDVDRRSGRLAYLRWLVDRGFAELDIPVAFATEARSALDRERLRQLEAGGESEPVAPMAVATPVGPNAPVAAGDAAALIAARDEAYERARRQADDIRLLVRSNKELRREVTGLRVRRWRDDERIAALDTELVQARTSLDRARRRGEHLAGEVASLRLRPWRILAAWGRPAARTGARDDGRQSVLAGDGPFFARGFRLGEAAEVAGVTVRRNADAPAGFLIFGPYVELPPGHYVATFEARLHRRLPLVAVFRVEIVCDAARQAVALHRFFLRSGTGWRRFELIFPVWDDKGHPDFEVRIWAGNRTPLEIGQLDLCRLRDDAADE